MLHDCPARTSHLPRSNIDPIDAHAERVRVAADMDVGCRVAEEVSLEIAAYFEIAAGVGVNLYSDARVLRAKAELGHLACWRRTVVWNAPEARADAAANIS